MWLVCLVFISDALITWLAAKSQVAFLALSWKALLWDGLLAIAIGLNFVGFVEKQWLMIIPSTLGSVTGMGIAIYNGKRARSRSDNISLL